MIQEIEILQPDECGEIITRVHDLHSSWIRRYMQVPFFTLAAASYLDAVSDPQQNYYALAKETNRILWNQFPDLYEKVSAALSTHLGAQVTYAKDFGLPGFHIFQGHPVFQREVMSVHFDLQYELLDWKRTIERFSPISYTLPIILPRNGAGLWHWNLMYDEVKDKTQEEKNQIIASRQRDYYQYRTGAMLLHTGQELHQIAAMGAFQGDEERITFQGHGLLIDGVWHLYW